MTVPGSHGIGNPSWLTASGDGSVISLFVQPRAAKDALAGVQGRALRVKVRASPVDGKANRAVEELLAQLLGTPRRSVSVTSGHTSRHKRIAVAGMAPDAVLRALGGVLSSPGHDPGEEAR
ncbi:MAG: DUF167 domain-containing protein [Actinomycetota bacterium]|nr:DUF167 domain-containing protein [Actinomycetota bacterium]